MRRMLATVVALGGLFLGAFPAHAGSIVVNTASGSVGGISLTNTGIDGSGTATIVIGQLPNSQSFINNVNGLTVAQDPVAVLGPLVLMVTPTATPGSYTLALNPPTGTAVFGTTPGAQGAVTFNQSVGVAPLVLPTFFNMSGTIVSLLSNLEPTYDFSKLPGGEMNFTFTGTSFFGTNSFNGLFSTVGASVVASGSFSISAVPEPTSVAMMGMGGVTLATMVFMRRKPKMITN